MKEAKGRRDSKKASTARGRSSGIEGLAETDGDVLPLGLMDALSDDEGESDGEVLAEGLSDRLSLILTLGDSLGETDTDSLPLGLMDALGERVAL